MRVLVIRIVRVVHGQLGSSSNGVMTRSRVTIGGILERVNIPSMGVTAQVVGDTRRNANIVVDTWSGIDSEFFSLTVDF